MKRFQIKDNFTIVDRHATPSRPAASGSTPTTRRCSPASSKDATSSTASPGSCATPRRRRPAGSARTRSAARTAPTSRAPAACPAGTTTDGRPAAVLPAEQQPRRHRARRGRRVRHQQRGVRAVHPGQVAGGPRPDRRLRLALGRAADAGNRRSEDHGVRVVPERSAVPVGRHDSRSDGSSSSRAAGSPGTSARPARRWCAAAPASTTRARTC